MQGQEKFLRRLLQCSPPRKSLVKGERFIRDWRETRVMNGLDTGPLYYSPSCGHTLVGWNWTSSTAWRTQLTLNLFHRNSTTWLTHAFCNCSSLVLLSSEAIKSQISVKSFQLLPWQQLSLCQGTRQSKLAGTHPDHFLLEHFSLSLFLFCDNAVCEHRNLNSTKRFW